MTRKAIIKLANRPKLWLILTLVWMAVIFMLSTNHFSSERTIAKIYTDIPLRYIAHLFVYLVLGFLASSAVNLNFNWKHKLFSALFFCLFYAFTDELHQFFETERRFRLIDIVTDTVGALAGILFFNFFYLKLLNRYVSSSQSDRGQ